MCWTQAAAAGVVAAVAALLVRIKEAWAQQQQGLHSHQPYRYDCDVCEDMRLQS